MRGNRRANTRPEMAVRRALHRAGFRYRVDFGIRTDAGLIHVDIAFPRQRLAVFVDGCFWHSCPAHGRRPASNPKYWDAKLRRNIERDARNGVSLAESGWDVLRIWEHVPAPEAVRRVALALAEGA